MSNPPALDVMIDIETAGDTGNAAILSIGAVAFHPMQGVPAAKGASRFFYRTVDLQSCLDLGMTVNGETFYWWLKQPESARNALTGGIDIHEALWDLRKWFSDCDPAGDTTDWEWKYSGRVWAWPPSFDLRILSNAIRLTHVPPFWKRRNERDARTFVTEIGVGDREAEAPKGLIEHHALDDATAQANLVSRAHQYLHHLLEADNFSHSLSPDAADKAIHAQEESPRRGEYRGSFDPQPEPPREIPTRYKPHRFEAALDRPHMCICGYWRADPVHIT